jgi:hypothetical protein
MREEHVLRVDLDLMFPADGLDVEENIIFDAYWAFDCAGLSILISRTFFGTSTRSVRRLFRRNRTGISGIAFQFRRESKPVWLCSVSTALKKSWSRSRSRIRKDFEYRTGPSNFAMSDPAEIDYLQLRESGRGHLQPERSHAS